MAYTPNEWGVGNLITASKMNKIERQLVVNTSDLDDIRNGVTVPTYEEFEDLVNNTVHVNEAQTLTTAQKDQARDNIEAASEEDVTSLKSAIISSLAGDAVEIVGTPEQHADLNNYTTPGNYKVMSAAKAALVDNAPATSIGYRLIVLQTTEAQRLAQIVILNSGGTNSRIAVRNYTGSWSAWQKLASKADIDAILPNLYSLSASDATSISSNDDLDTYTTAGNYKCTSSAIAGSLSHCPTSVAFALKVIQLSQSQRIMQMLYAQGVAMPVYRRFYDGTSWKDWHRDANYDEITYLSNTILTSNNLTTYFPNSSFNDAKPNTIYGIFDSSLLTDGPVGDEWTGTADRSAGGIRGTLYTLSQAVSHDAMQTGLAQIFVGWRNTNYSPTLSYRIATYSSGSYSWSNWSKFEQNGYLHSSNVIVYGGSMDKSFDDMNNMPSNTIYQLDLNLDGSDAAHTLANHPAPGVSCVAMCYAFSYTSQHGKVQTVYTIDGRLYWRYGYLQAHNDYRWTAWNQVVSDAGDYLRNKGRLENGIDLNTIQENAVYMLGGQAGANYINNPLTSGAGYLTVKHNGNITLQTVEALGGTRYSRYTENGSTWSNWT